MILVIYAHPIEEGHCGAILSEVKQRLEANKLEHEILDLYEMNYSPVMRANELYTAGGSPDEDTKKIQEKISKADKLIIIYPVWWNTMPAILKGFFDRTFTSGYAYQFVKGGIPQKLLSGKKAAVFVTTGARKAIYWLFLGNRGISLIRKDILGFCGIDSKVFHLAHATKMDESKKPEVRKLVDAGFKYLLN